MPRINMECKVCQTKYTVGDLMSPSVTPCPKCGNKDNKVLGSSGSQSSRKMSKT
jgi:predicted nucleic acid-binding Zn ribbon protein